MKRVNIVKVGTFVMKMYVKGIGRCVGDDEEGNGNMRAWSTKCDAIEGGGSKQEKRRRTLKSKHV